MMHTKFKSHESFGSREEDFLSLVLFFFTIYGHGGHLGHVTSTV